uniref:hypothetical protein n=1 Tax=Candidatus Thiodubiliella endoseptemdiera TaxID=2738886 RepID=UPI0034DF080E
MILKTKIDKKLSAFKVFLFLIILYVLVSVFFPWKSKLTTYSIDKNEHYYNNIFCDSLGGKIETKHYYKYNTKQSFVKIDCETENYVYEGGLDKRSSLDSVQQVKFFSILTGKKPAIVIYDTDGEFGKYEYRIKQVAKSLGVKFILEKQ